MTYTGNSKHAVDIQQRIGGLGQVQVKRMTKQEKKAAAIWRNRMNGYAKRVKKAKAQTFNIWVNISGVWHKIDAVPMTEYLAKIKLEDLNKTIHEGLIIRPEGKDPSPSASNG